MRELGVIDLGYVHVRDGTIASLGAGAPPAAICATRHDLCGRVLMPAFVDCHTHALWAGSRYDEVAKRLAGVPYLEILAGGGGILSTVRATRAALERDPRAPCCATSSPCAHVQCVVVARSRLR